jgi:hypothetical protein
MNQYCLSNQLKRVSKVFTFKAATEATSVNVFVRSWKSKRWESLKCNITFRINVV